MKVVKKLKEKMAENRNRISYKCHFRYKTDNIQKIRNL